MHDRDGQNASREKRNRGKQSPRKLVKKTSTKRNGMWGGKVDLLSPVKGSDRKILGAGEKEIEPSSNGKHTIGNFIKNISARSLALQKFESSSPKSSKRAKTVKDRDLRHIEEADAKKSDRSSHSRKNQGMGKPGHRLRTSISSLRSGPRKIEGQSAIN